MVKKPLKRPVCENCGSGYIYITQTKIVCRRCGYVKKKGKINTKARIEGLKTNSEVKL